MKNPCEQCQNYRAHYIKTENGYEKSPHGDEVNPKVWTKIK